MSPASVRLEPGSLASIYTALVSGEIDRDRGLALLEARSAWASAVVSLEVAHLASSEIEHLQGLLVRERDRLDDHDPEQVARIEVLRVWGNALAAEIEARSDRRGRAPLSRGDVLGRLVALADPEASDPDRARVLSAANGALEERAARPHHPFSAVHQGIQDLSSNHRSRREVLLAYLSALADVPDLSRFLERRPDPVVRRIARVGYETLLGERDCLFSDSPLATPFFVSPSRYLALLLEVSRVEGEVVTEEFLWSRIREYTRPPVHCPPESLEDLDSLWIMPEAYAREEAERLGGFPFPLLSSYDAAHPDRLETLYSEDADEGLLLYTSPHHPASRWWAPPPTGLLRLALALPSESILHVGDPERQDQHDLYVQLVQRATTQSSSDEEYRSVLRGHLANAKTQAVQFYRSGEDGAVTERVWVLRPEPGSLMVLDHPSLRA